jgi:phosphate transport system protein
MQQIKLGNQQNCSKILSIAMLERAKHIISSFDSALYGLRNDVLMMSSLTDRMLQTAFEAFLKRDRELCDLVVAEDEEIDTLEKRVDEEGVGLLLRFQPVASDMREVISAMKVSTSLERIADQSVTIARRAKSLNDRPAVREVALLEPAYWPAMAIFRDSIRAFAEGDFELARTLKLKDRELDTLTSDLTEKLTACAASESESMPSCLDLIFIARALEHVGDYATHIAEDSFWRDQCADIRHTYKR